MLWSLGRGDVVVGDVVVGDAVVVDVVVGDVVVQFVHLYINGVCCASVLLRPLRSVSCF